MKKVFLNLSLLSPVMESSPVFSNWSSIFDYKFIYMGRMGVTLNTAHDTAQTHTPVRVCTDGTNSYQCTVSRNVNFYEIHPKIKKFHRMGLNDV